jgi:hypothetical protein
MPVFITTSGAFTTQWQTRSYMLTKIYRQSLGKNFDLFASATNVKVIGGRAPSCSHFIGILHAATHNSSHAPHSPS